MNLKYLSIILGVSGVSIGLGSASVEIGVTMFWTLFTALVVGIWRVATLLSRINAKFDAGDARMTNTESRTTKVENRCDTIEGEVANTKERISKLEGRVSAR